MNKIGRPNINDAPTWYEYFFSLTAGDDLIEALRSTKKQTVDLINSIPPSKVEFRYAENKWTIKQVFIHLVDEERYFVYKAFCYSRRMDVFLETQMSEEYTKDFNAGNRTLQDIAEEFIALRDSTIRFFAGMTTEMLDFKDLPGKDVYSARSLGWFTVGHNLHHLNLLRERYLNS